MGLFPCVTQVMPSTVEIQKISLGATDGKFKRIRQADGLPWRTSWAQEGNLPPTYLSRIQARGGVRGELLEMLQKRINCTKFTKCTKV